MHDYFGIYVEDMSVLKGVLEDIVSGDDDAGLAGDTQATAELIIACYLGDLQVNSQREEALVSERKDEKNEKNKNIVEDREIKNQFQIKKLEAAINPRGTDESN